MFKVLALIALVASVASAQDSGESAAAPEPYAYAYQADNHQASEQRAPDGTVTGFYTLNDADGRERRVEYIADASGFRAKVATNELGTKSANSADVEVLASPPTESQLVYQAPSQQVQLVNKQQQQVYQQQVYQQPRVVTGGQTTTTTFSQAPQTQSSTRYFQQPASYQGVTYGYYPGYQNGAYGYSTTTDYANKGLAYGVQGGSYNYHLPAQYYSNVQGARYTSYQQPATYTSYQQPATYTSYQQQPTYAYGGYGNSRVFSQNVQTVPGSSYTYTTGSVPVGSSYTYTSGSVPVSSTTTRTSSSSSQGSGNLLLLQKK